MVLRSVLAGLLSRLGLLTAGFNLTPAVKCCQTGTNKGTPEYRLTKHADALRGNQWKSSDTGRKALGLTQDLAELPLWV